MPKGAILRQGLARL